MNSSRFLTLTCETMPCSSLPRPLPSFQPIFSICRRAKADTVDEAASFTMPPNAFMNFLPTSGTAASVVVVAISSLIWF